MRVPIFRYFTLLHWYMKYETKASAISSTHSFKKRDAILSGPLAFLGSRSFKSLTMPFLVNRMLVIFLGLLVVHNSNLIILRMSFPLLVSQHINSSIYHSSLTWYIWTAFFLFIDTLSFIKLFLAELHIFYYVWLLFGIWSNHLRF